MTFVLKSPPRERLRDRWRWWSTAFIPTLLQRRAGLWVRGQPGLQGNKRKRKKDSGPHWSPEHCVVAALLSLGLNPRPSGLLWWIPHTRRMASCRCLKHWQTNSLKLRTPFSCLFVVALLCVCGRNISQRRHWPLRAVSSAWLPNTDLWFYLFSFPLLFYFSSSPRSFPHNACSRENRYVGKQ